MTIPILTTCFSSPVGQLRLTSDGEALTGILLPQEVGEYEQGKSDDCAVLARAITQLQEYFAGKRREFNLPLSPQGTAFQQTVWHALRQIPCGKTASYRQIAEAIGNPKASRAIGSANHHNPIPIIIPCHRVIGSSGKLVGYRGGLALKTWLLTHERESGD
jgi:methylated-DNA-[protein]-cysteine S-methyltransferase